MRTAWVLNMLIDIKTFKPAEQSRIVSDSLFRHKMSRGKLSDSTKNWFCKEAETPAVAKLEVLAQEFFRLIIPHQPETRLAINKVSQVHYVLSEEIEGYRKLPRGESRKFENGTYSGLGQAMVCALFLEEHDLKNGNIGLDAHNRVIKIDGDWSFASTQGIDKAAFSLTEDGIAQLPYPMGIRAFNWLDYIQETMSYSTSQIVRPALSSNLAFRNEVNQALLKIVSLPDSFINHFVDQHISAGGKQYSDLIQQRAHELRNICLQNKSFQAYLDTQEASEVRQNIQNQIHPFIIRPIELTAPIVEQKNISAIERISLMETSLSCLMKILQIKESNPALYESYVVEQLQEWESIKTDIHKIVDLHTKIDAKLTALQSAKQQDFKNRFKNELYPADENNDIISQLTKP